ncbi:cation diffusion facilitator family transporter [Saccharomonospora viridis]|jgi:cobalt-zinc-cadmium efflux system protein|uniref:Cation diffusion facilitator family transporter n=2 Tax=Saccharomonospora viridis TaxID=1852 RepID=C7MX62_SACVD|nr:cation diffusion facilitator family transporter [Saccharomonospora viridis]ACU97979.1 cation diffusion facilitator family transporter [Saccharomonospora viridis DSM 43017]KHF45948.1 cation transporter [Saccharomonospora viridis]SFP38815.1 cobalt-zinc-cadmium efflux system protein [Saccharomonospora viridis]
MGHGHGHGHLSPRTDSASGRYIPALVAALVIGATVMVAEFTVGFATSSLALISDAAHMFTDVLGIGMALVAVQLARRSGPTFTRTFGMYRAEVLAALANAILLFGVAGYVVYEAITRITDPPEVPGLPVLVVASIGLVANLIAFLLLRRGAQESLNVRGAYLEVLSDLIGSVGVLISGVVTLTTGWHYADPLVGVAIGVFVLPRTVVLARRALRILFQHAPHNIDVEALHNDLCALSGVEDVHDLHVWTLTSGMEVASAHLTVGADVDTAHVLASAQHLLSSRYAIEHATLQVEPRESARRCAQLTW